MSETNRTINEPSCNIDVYIEAAWTGVDLSDYDLYVSLGYDGSEVLEAYKDYGSLDCLKETVTDANGYTPKFLNRKLGVDFDDQSIHSSAHLLRLAGVTKAERRQLQGVTSISQYFYRAARRSGSTHSECLEAHELGLKMHDYAFLITKGFSHADILQTTLQLKSRDENLAA